MDFIDFCYRTSMNLSCPYSNLTCKGCPFSWGYRNSRLGFQILAEGRNFILNTEYGIKDL